jgi:fused-like protein
VGNAAFHSRNLYPHLSSCLRALHDILSDSDEKTRANAAGAIGNLVRNSGELCESLAALGTVETMMEMVIRDKDITTQRIALFSIGTMAVYNHTRSVSLS